MAVILGADIKLNTGELARDSRRAADTVERELGGGFTRLASTATRALASIGSTATSIIAAPVKLLTSLPGLIGTALAGAAVDKLIRDSAALTVQVDALANRMGRSPRDVRAYLAAINDAGKGLLSFGSAAQLANKAAVFELAPTSVARLASISAGLAVAQGEADGFRERFGQLLEQIGQAKAARLDDFGIFIDARDLEGLTLQQQRARVLQESIKQLEAQSKALGVSGREAFFQYAGIFANVKDLTIELARTVTQSNEFQGIAERINAFTGSVARLVRDGKGFDLLKTLGLSGVRLGSAIVQDLPETISKALLEGVGLALEALGAVDFSVLGSAVAAAIAQGIQKAMPLLARGFGITDQTIAAARSASDLGSLGSTLRDRAAQMEVFRRTRSVVGDTVANLTNIPDARATQPIRGAAEALGDFAFRDVDAEALNEARRRRSQNPAARLREIEAAVLAADPITQREGEGDQAFAGRRARELVERRRRARELARVESASDLALGRVAMSPDIVRQLGQLRERTDLTPEERERRLESLLNRLPERDRNAIIARERITQTPTAEEARQRDLRRGVRPSVPDPALTTIDEFVQGGRPAPSDTDPLRNTLGQLGLSPDASMRDAFMAALLNPANLSPSSAAVMDAAKRGGAPATELGGAVQSLAEIMAGAAKAPPTAGSVAESIGRSLMGMVFGGATPGDATAPIDEFDQMSRRPAGQMHPGGATVPFWMRGGGFVPPPTRQAELASLEEKLRAGQPMEASDIQRMNRLRQEIAEREAMQRRDRERIEQGRAGADTAKAAERLGDAAEAVEGLPEAADALARVLERFASRVGATA